MERGMSDWPTIDSAPKDRFILLYCPEDDSIWFAKWQGGEWYGVDDQGLTRSGNSHDNDPDSWYVSNWHPLPSKPE